ncbi:IS66 family transposase [Undibacterium sp. CY18W]|uniref:IS66 family transposase n=1 Tax=Undibacterium hunanense TaxID=2762292 RepID=A0ABR6ZZ78_9BURK|nr:IS66 family transposase [Undibacterium hunanense]MBC3921170.1 IS66 family transposase [Undibacterium hunanense]
MIKIPDLRELSGEQKDVLIVELISTLNAMAVRINALEARLIKDSHNSSKPPSTDGLQRKPKSLRQTGGKVGGQPGHPGKTLKRLAYCDHTVVHPIATRCDACGSHIPLDDISLSVETRQVVDLPPIRLEVTAHRVEVALCCCGKLHTGVFPADLTQAVQYGPQVKAAAVYLTQYQQLPVERTAQALHDLFGLNLSTGTLQNYINEGAKRLLPMVGRINQAIQIAPVVHFDETSMHVGRAQQWLHSASTVTLTWYGAHLKRGKEALDSFGILPVFAGVAVHDGWKPYAHYTCLHSLCNAHHLRELIFIEETTKQTWAKEMIDLLRAAKKEVDHSLVIGRQSLEPTRTAHYLSRYQILLNQAWELNPKQERDPTRIDTRGCIKQTFTYNLLARLSRYSDDVWRFMTDHRVPFDNNRAERDIRMPKLKQKISGCFRTTHGFAAFCTIRSYLATLRKQELPLFNSLVLSFSGNVPQPYLGAE